MRKSRWFRAAAGAGCVTAASIFALGHNNGLVASEQPETRSSKPGTVSQPISYTETTPLGADQLKIDGVAAPYPVWFATALPGNVTELSVAPGHTVTLDGELVAGAGWQRQVTAPDKPGVYELRVTDADGGDLFQIAYFVLEPAKNIQRGRLNGYRIGTYPVNAPEGFIRLDNRNDQETSISPHFRIGQFLCKQQPAHWPKYLLVTPDLLNRLEVLLAELRDDKVTDADTLFVMSGYRTPFYNTAIGSAKRSRHMWGDAADIYIDVAPRDGQMDDLNRDGKITKGDSNWLYDYAASLYATRQDVVKGGIGAYRANAVHGPFVHIDGRGQQARWGR